METKIIHLRTHHGYDFVVKLYNSKSVSHFGCLNWEALCKAYDFQEGMYVTFYLGDHDDGLWVLVGMLPPLPLREFLKHIYEVIYIFYFKIIDILFQNS